MDSGHEKISEGPDWTRGDLLRPQPAQARAVPRFGVLPGAGDRHLAEFFPGFLTEESDWGERWGVHLTTIEERERRQGRHIADLEEMLAPDEISSMPSGELVAPVIDSLELDQPGWFPLNIPNAGQCPDLPTGVVVESICIADGDGRARPRRGPPAADRRRACAGSRRPRSSRSRPRSAATARRCSRRCSPTRWPAASTSTGSGEMTDEMLARRAPGCRSSPGSDGDRSRRRRATRPRPARRGRRWARPRPATPPR